MWILYMYNIKNCIETAINCKTTRSTLFMHEEFENEKKKQKLQFLSNAIKTSSNDLQYSVKYIYGFHGLIE